MILFTSVRAQNDASETPAQMKLYVGGGQQGKLCNSFSPRVFCLFSIYFRLHNPSPQLFRRIALPQGE